MDTLMTIRLQTLAQGSEKITDAKNRVNQLDDATKKSTKSADNFGKSLQSLGSRINVLGQRMTGMLTLPMLFFANSAINTAVDVERSWVRFNKVFGGTEEEFQQMRKIGTEFSNKFGQDVEKVNGVMAEFSKAGIEGVDALTRLTQLGIETSMLFDSTLEEATAGVTAVMLGFGLSIDDTADALASINIIADNTASSEKGIMTAMEKTGGIARTYGVSIREVAAMTAVLQQNNITGAVAGNAMKSMMQKLGNVTDKAHGRMLDFGIDMRGNDFRTKSFTEKLEVLGKKQSEIFNSGDKARIADWNTVMSDSVGIFQGGRAAILLEDFGKQMDDNADTMSTYSKAMDISKDATANLVKWNEQLKKQMESDPFNLDVQNQLYRNQAAILGAKLLPWKIKLLEVATKLIEKFNGLSKETQDWILIALGLIAVAGPILMVIGLFTTLIGFSGTVVKVLIGNFSKITSTVNGVKTSITKFNPGLLANPWVILALAIGTAVGLIAASKGKLDKTLEDLGNTNITIRSSNAGALEKSKSMSPEKQAQVQQAVKQSEQLVMENEVLINRYSGLVGIWHAVQDQAVDIWTALTTWLVTKWNEIKTAISNKWEEIKLAIGNKLLEIWDSLVARWNSITAWFSGAWESVKTFFVNLPLAIFDAVFIALGYTWAAIKDGWNYLVTNIPIWINLVVETIKGLPAAALQIMTTVYSAIVSKMKEAWDYLKINVPVWIDAVITFVKGLPEKARNALSLLASYIGEKFTEAWTKAKEIWEKIKTSVVEIAKEIPGAVKDALQGVVKSVEDVFNDAWEKAKEIWGKVKDLYDRAKEKFQEGQDKYKSANGGIVPEHHANGGLVYAANGFLSKGRDTIPAMLSPGEMVLNKSQQSTLFDVLSGKSQMQTAGGVSVNINVGTMIASRGEQREFARKIEELLNENNARK